MELLKSRPHSAERSNRRVTTQTEKAQAFRALLERSSAFIIPNPWDEQGTFTFAKNAVRPREASAIFG
jgi:hypothetical protein